MIMGVVFIFVKILKVIICVVVRMDLNWIVMDIIVLVSIFLIYFYFVFIFKKVIEIDVGIFIINFYNVNVFIRGIYIYLDNGVLLLILCL